MNGVGCAVIRVRPVDEFHGLSLALIIRDKHVLRVDHRRIAGLRGRVDRDGLTGLLIGIGCVIRADAAASLIHHFDLDGLGLANIHEIDRHIILAIIGCSTGCTSGRRILQLVHTVVSSGVADCRIDRCILCNGNGFQNTDFSALLIHGAVNDVAFGLRIVKGHGVVCAGGFMVLRCGIDRDIARKRRSLIGHRRSDLLTHGRRSVIWERSAVQRGIDRDLCRVVIVGEEDLLCAAGCRSDSKGEVAVLHTIDLVGARHRGGDELLPDHGEGSHGVRLRALLHELGVLVAGDTVLVHALDMNVDHALVQRVVGKGNGLISRGALAPDRITLQRIAVDAGRDQRQRFTLDDLVGCIVVGNMQSLSGFVYQADRYCPDIRRVAENNDAVTLTGHDFFVRLGRNIGILRGVSIQRRSSNELRLTGHTGQRVTADLTVCCGVHQLDGDL